MAKAKDETKTGEAAADTKLPKTEPVSALKVSDIDEVIYIPGPGDPHTTRWNGITFKANVPVKLSRSSTVQVLERVSSELPDGTVVSKAVEKRVPMVTLARGNLCFMVNGVAPTARSAGEVSTPTDSRTYRSYALEWIAGSTAPSAMDARWNAEEGLRDTCQCDDDDIAYLRPFFEARHAAIGGPGRRPQREILMGLTRAELALEAQRAR